MNGIHRRYCPKCLALVAFKSKTSRRNYHLDPYPQNQMDFQRSKDPYSSCLPPYATSLEMLPWLPPNCCDHISSLLRDQFDIIRVQPSNIAANEGRSCVLRQKTDFARQVIRRWAQVEARKNSRIILPLQFA